MARLNHGQRLDMLEQEEARLPARMAGEITTALTAFKTDLNSQLAAGQEKIRSDLRSSLTNGLPLHGITHFHLSLSWETEKVVTKGGNRIGNYENSTYLCLTVQTRMVGFSELSVFFHFYRLGEEYKLEAAIVALDGDALLWYQWERRCQSVLSWDALKKLVLRHFRTTAISTLHEQWLAHEQIGTVTDYQRRFIELLAPIEGFPEEIAKGQYIKGLTEEIQIEVRILDPN